MNDTKQERSRNFGRKGVLLMFSLCALADFAWSIFSKRSVAESVVSALLGLFGTGWYLLAMWAASRNNPDDPNEPARWVP